MADTHEAAAAALAAKRLEKEIAVPTADADVRRMLRELKEPMTLFGEEAAHRRERLRKLLAQRVMEGQALPQAVQDAAAATAASSEIPVRALMLSPAR
jgi:U4/U6 small nuclear ribonucleoprotein PRP4